MRAAAKLAGGAPRLRDRLGVRSAQMLAWLSGAQDPPRHVFLRSVEMLLDDLERRRP